METETKKKIVNETKLIATVQTNSLSSHKNDTVPSYLAAIWDELVDKVGAKELMDTLRGLDPPEDMTARVVWTFAEENQPNFKEK